MSFGSAVFVQSLLFNRLFICLYRYISFWGGAETGGCCNYFSGIYTAGPGNDRPDAGKWGLEFSIQIIETVRGVYLVSSACAWIYTNHFCACIFP